MILNFKFEPHKSCRRCEHLTHIMDDKEKITNSFCWAKAGILLFMKDNLLSTCKKRRPIIIQKQI